MSWTGLDTLCVQKRRERRLHHACCNRGHCLFTREIMFSDWKHCYIFSLICMIISGHERPVCFHMCSPNRRACTSIIPRTSASCWHAGISHASFLRAVWIVIYKWLLRQFFLLRGMVVYAVNVANPKGRQENKFDH